MWFPTKKTISKNPLRNQASTYHGDGIERKLESGSANFTAHSHFQQKKIKAKIWYKNIKTKSKRSKAT